MTTDLSIRQIAHALGISRTVVATTIRAFQASGLEYPTMDTMPDSLLIQAMAGEGVQEKSARYQELSQRFPAMVVELKEGSSAESVGAFLVKNLLESDYPPP